MAVIKKVKKVGENCVMYDANGEEGLAYLNKKTGFYESGCRPIQFSQEFVDSKLVSQEELEKEQ